MTGRVELFATGVFDAAGRAEARTPPVPWGREYRITSTVVHTTLTARTAATLYRNSVLDSNRIDTTKNRGNGATSDVAVTLYAGEVLVCVWTGGTAGAVADMTATGEG